MLQQKICAANPEGLRPVAVADVLEMVVAAGSTAHEDISQLERCEFEIRIGEVVVSYRSFPHDSHRISDTRGNCVDLMSVYFACTHASTRPGQRKISEIHHSYDDGELSLIESFKPGRPSLRR